MEVLTLEQARALLTASAVGHLAVISEGEPYVTPISFVVMDGAIWLRTGGGRRVEAIRANPRVCVEVSEYDLGSGNWKSVLVWGRAEVSAEEGGHREVVMALMDKYRSAIGSPLSPGRAFPEPGVMVRIPIEQISGRTSGSFFSARTRPGRL